MGNTTCMGIKNANSSKESFETTLCCEAKHMSRDCVMNRRIHPKQHQSC